MQNDLIYRSDLWTDIMMLPHNGDIISSEEVEQAIVEAPAVDAVEVVHCEQCLYRSQYANEEGLYKCGAIECKEGHCAIVAPDFSCIAGKKRGKDDGK